MAVCSEETLEVLDCKERNVPLKYVVTISSLLSFGDRGVALCRFHCLPAGLLLLSARCSQRHVVGASTRPRWDVVHMRVICCTPYQSGTNRCIGNRNSRHPDHRDCSNHLPHSCSRHSFVPTVTRQQTGAVLQSSQNVNFYMCISIDSFNVTTTERKQTICQALDRLSFNRKFRHAKKKLSYHSMYTRVGNQHDGQSFCSNKSLKRS